jgi:tetratricopeptide (TPR) repeat protein
LLEYRKGRWDTAAEFLKKLGAEWPAIQPIGAALRAMTCHQQKQTVDAAAELARARDHIVPNWPETAKAPGSWQDWLIAHLLLREAQSLIRPPSLEEVMVLQGQFAEVASHLRKRLEEAGSDTDTSMDWLRLGFAALEQGNREDYRAVCKRMLEQFRTTTAPPQAERVVKLCLASPDSGIGVAEVRALLDVQQTAPNVVGDAYYRFSHGLVAYRAGELREAVDSLRAVNLRPYMTAPAAAVLAMAYYKQGDAAGAAQELRKGRNQIGPEWPGVFAWHERSLAKVLLQEAEKLIGAESATAEKR